MGGLLPYYWKILKNSQAATVVRLLEDALNRILRTREATTKLLKDTGGWFLSY
jgi:hypothetical protein